jgi:hypothetical protein
MEKIMFWQNRNKSEIDFIIEKNWKITPLEVKTWNKDLIPKIFSSFSLDYKDIINHFIKTTKFTEFEREINWFKVIWKSFLSNF